jgi:hypothetical protein
LAVWRQLSNIGEALKLYIETTVPNFLFAQDAPDKRRATELFFEWLEVASDQLFISRLVEDEIAACPEPKRSQMIKVLSSLPLQVLLVPPECSALADQYVQAGIVPARFKNDALHVAVAVWHKLEVVVSWNMAHLVNVRKVERINAVNERGGLPHIRIHTPEEVLDL